MLKFTDNIKVNTEGKLRTIGVDGIGNPIYIMENGDEIAVVIDSTEDGEYNYY